MATKKQVVKRAKSVGEKYPVFKNVADLKSSPRSPVIVHFTKEQWAAATKGVKFAKEDAIDAKRPALAYQLAPWGNGDMIVYPSFRTRLTLNCHYELEVVPVLNGWRIKHKFVCQPMVRGKCDVVFELYTGGAHKNASGFRCDNVDCTGRCEAIHAGNHTLGEVQCGCRLRLP